MKNNRIYAAFISALLLGTSMVYAQEAIPVRKNMKMPKASAEMVSFDSGHLSAAFLREQNTGLKADFTCQTEAGEVVAWSDNFDSGVEGWTFDNPEHFAWTTKKITSASNPAKDYATIDPDDVQSLYIEGDYRIYNRGTAVATSPLITIPRNGSLSGHAGFSLNFSDDCTLSLFIGSGEEWNKIWSSADDKGEKPWMWRTLKADLSAYAGKEMQLRFVYGCDKDYNNWGHTGDFAIDGLKITGAGAVESVNVQTGEAVKLADLSTGEPTSWSWSFPGGTPETSTEQNPEVYYTKDGVYDITLTVSNENGSDHKTRTGFVKVTGSSPVAAILPPATFRFSTTRLPMIAPLVPVDYKDASSNYPTSWEWNFTGVDAEPYAVTASAEQNPTVGYSFLHQQEVTLHVKNQHGESDASTSVSVEYSGFINNLEPGDQLFNFNLGDGYGEFPGTNKLKITEYAEKFSKPSRPVLVTGAMVYFTNAMATSLIDQITDVSVDLCSSENGLPGERLNTMSWRVFELDQPSGSSLVGTAFEFTNPTAVDDEFFFVVRGIPEKNDTVKVAFATAKFRDHGNTAYFKQREEWKAASDYFPAGQNHTSYAISPFIIHSVMTPMIETPLVVGAEAGTVDLPFYSIQGYQTPVGCDADWCEVVGEPNGLTLDTLSIAYQKLPAGMQERTATFTLTDGNDKVAVKLIQKSSGSGIQSIVNEKRADAYPSVFKDRFTVSLPEKAVRIVVSDASGKIMYRQEITPELQELAISGKSWMNGMYFVKIMQEEKTTVIKVLKQ